MKEFFFFFNLIFMFLFYYSAFGYISSPNLASFKLFDNLPNMSFGFNYSFTKKKLLKSDFEFSEKYFIGIIFEFFSFQLVIKSIVVNRNMSQ